MESIMQKFIYKKDFYLKQIDADNLVNNNLIILLSLKYIFLIKCVNFCDLNIISQYEQNEIINILKKIIYG